MPLVVKLMILAMACQALLAVIILVLMGRERVPRVMSGEIPMADIAVARDAYPLKARLLSNNFDNQFQLPVLFYVGCLLALLTGLTNWPEVLVAWLFVVSRYVHATIHVTTNRLHARFGAYCFGLVALAILWLLVLFRLLLS